jgi:hypothetical protein
MPVLPRPFSIDAGATNGRQLFLLPVSAEAGAHVLPETSEQSALVLNLADLVSYSL